ncbi:MAG: DUF3459 domain-containing protein [Acholeplasmatales bacterium]|nr:MAG: DUF3459 domain-containing protein [Acholeplasmatales bacterium]
MQAISKGVIPMFRRLLLASLTVLMLVTLSACFLFGSDPEEPDVIDFASLYPNHGNWYQLFVRSFADSSGDGVGDFRGIAENLDYFVDLGIDGIWLMPIHPTSSKHGYDVEDFFAINPEYGTMADFEHLLAEAAKLDIKIIIDYVLNHTSEKHPWFTAFKNGEAPYDQFYHRQSSSSRPTTLGSWGQSIWHGLGGNQWYIGYFGGYMPDLNWNNPVVRDKMVEIAHFWLEKGVAGFRLDAAMHIQGIGKVPAGISPIDQTKFELEYFEFHVKDVYPDAYIIGEVWTAFSTYVEFFDVMDSVFHFDYANLAINAINAGSAHNYVNQVINWENATQARKDPVISAPFLRNHDQDRLATDLSGDPGKLRLAAEMLLTVPGNPFLYYGEELGVKGNRSGTAPIWDESVRLPMLFDSAYRTTWPINDWNYHDPFNGDVASVEAQQANPDSLWHVYARLLNLRQDTPALRYGRMVAYPGNTGAFQAFYRIYEHDDFREIVLVIHNLSNSEVTVFEQGEALYYTEHTYAGKLAPRSTVILRVPDALIDQLGE